MIVLDTNKAETPEISAEPTKKSDNVKTEPNTFQTKASSLVNGSLEGNNTVTVTSSLRPYHETYTETNDIPNSKELFHNQRKKVEESEDEEDEEKEDDEDNGTSESKEEENSPKLGDYKFDVR